MNSYNDNLHSGIVSSLQSLEQDFKKVDSEANAAMFTLYYAEGATISAESKLEDAKVKQDSQELVKEQAVKNSNLSINLLASATQANDYLKQSTSNAAIAASNVQIAANAIVRLSSDIGSIFNIVQAANFDTEISDQAEQANHYIRKTAYAAEFASQSAMEASVLTAKVSSATVQDKAKTTNSFMNNMLKVVSDGYDAISKLVSDDNAALATTSAAEKKSEGTYEDVDTVRKATQRAYALTNQELNLNLTATPVKGKESSDFKVSFNMIKSPFKENSKNTHYPVKEHYLFLVKDKQKANFSINTAENMIQEEDSRRFIQLQIDEPPISNPEPQHEIEFNSLAIPGKKNTTYHLQDSDGQDVTTGTNYVVFLFAVYEEEYKRKLNTYDEYLSAPSPVFCLTNYLVKARFTASSPDTAADNNNIINFTVAENHQFSGYVEYRCILLPMNENPSESNMATAKSLAELDEEINQLRKIASKLDPQISSFESKQVATSRSITQLKKKHKSFLQDLDEEFKHHERKLKSSVSDQKPGDVAKSFVSSLKSEKTSSVNTSGEHKDIAETYITLLLTFHADKTELDTLNKEKKDYEKKLKQIHASKIGFLFNQQLAEQVSAGNYIVAKSAAATESKPKKQEDEATQFPEIKWMAQIENDTTDNFGNPLKKDQVYTPVILSVSTAAETNLSKFTNAWTGYENSPQIKIK